MTRGIPNEDFPNSRMWAKGKGPYPCTKCNFVTLYKDWLKQHNAKVHGN